MTGVRANFTSTTFSSSGYGFRSITFFKKRERENLNRFTLNTLKQILAKNCAASPSPFPHCLLIYPSSSTAFMPSESFLLKGNTTKLGAKVLKLPRIYKRKEATFLEYLLYSRHWDVLSKTSILFK